MDYQAAREIPADGSTYVRTKFGDVGVVAHKVDTGISVQFTLRNVRDRFGHVVPAGGCNGLHVHNANCWPVAVGASAPRAD